MSILIKDYIAANTNNINIIQLITSDSDYNITCLHNMLKHKTKYNYVNDDINLDH